MLLVESIKKPHGNNLQFKQKPLLRNYLFWLIFFLVARIGVFHIFWAVSWIMFAFSIFTSASVSFLARVSDVYLFVSGLHEAIVKLA